MLPNRSLSLLVPLALAMALAACGEEDPVPPLATDSCGAVALQGLRGQNRSVLETMRFSGTTRIIEPGTAVTMDFQDSRLNIWIGETGLIDRVTCG